MAGHVALALLLASPVLADCTQSGATVTCSGADNDGFDAGAQNDLALTVQSGATVSVGNNATAILLNDNNTATNNGTITAGANGIGIQANSTTTINNFGTISVGAAGVGIQFITNANTLNNFGVIRSVGDGYSVETCVCTATSAIINNSGTLDGRLNILGVGHTVNNRGLITITDSAAGTPIGFVHTIQNTTGAGAGNAFNQFSGATLALRMNNAGAIDLLIADAISPDGTLRVTIQSGLYPAQLVSGTAISVTPPGTITTPFSAYVSSSPFFTVTPIYSGGAATSTDYTDLNVQIDRIAFNAVPGLTPNQRAVSNALEFGYSTTLTGNAATFYGNLLAATSTGVFDLLSGEGTVATQGTAFNSGTMFQSAMQDQIQLWFSNPPLGIGGAPLAYASIPKREHAAFAAIKPVSRVPEAQPWRAWASGFGGSQEVDGDPAAGTADASQRGGGVAIGANYAAHPDLLLGLSVGGSMSSFSVTERATSGDLRGLHLGAFGIKTWNAFYLAGTLSYAHFNNETERTISGIGTTETATGDFSSDLLTGRLEAGGGAIWANSPSRLSRPSRPRNFGSMPIPRRAEQRAVRRASWVSAISPRASHRCRCPWACRWIRQSPWKAGVRYRLSRAWPGCMNSNRRAASKPPSSPFLRRRSRPKDRALQRTR